MFISHGPTIAAFKDCFFQDEDEQLYYRPAEDCAPMPVSYAEYVLWTDKFEFQHQIGMIGLWLGLLLGTGYGHYRWFQTDDFSSIFIWMGAGFLVGCGILFNRNVTVAMNIRRKYEVWVNRHQSA